MMNRLRWVLIALGIVFCIVVIAINVLPNRGPAQTSPQGNRQLLYVVPQGTIAKVGTGLSASVLPNQVELTIGKQDTLVIRNEDLYPIEVGGLLIHPGQQYKQQFTKPGTFDLLCSVHDDTKIRVIVKEQ